MQQRGKPPGYDRPTLPYTYIRHDEEIAPLIDKLSRDRCTRLAIDVEAEHNLHRYGIHVCLIQLFDGRQAYLVDVLALKRPSCLRPLLEKAPWTLVWFNAASDLLSIEHDLGLKPSPILDLDIAARLLGRQGGLAALTDRPESPSAKERLQRANWMRRPLPPVMLEYAIADVLDLLPLADKLMDELHTQGLMDVFIEKNRAVEEAKRSWDPFANYTRIPGFKGLPRSGKRLARLLWYARELYAKNRNIPSVLVASKEHLRRLVDKGWHSGREIAAFLNNNRKRYHIDPDRFQACLRKAEAMPEPPPPPRRYPRRAQG
jgi:ribonuclease D